MCVTDPWERKDSAVRHFEFGSGTAGDLAYAGQVADRGRGEQCFGGSRFHGGKKLKILPITEGMVKRRAAIMGSGRNWSHWDIACSDSGANAAFIEQVIQVRGETVTDIDQGVQAA